MKFKHLLFLSLFTQTIFGTEEEPKLKFDRKICNPLSLHDLSLKKVVGLYAKAADKTAFLNKFDIDLQQEIVGFTDDSGKYIFEHAHAENDKYVGVGSVKFSKCENYIVSSSVTDDYIANNLTAKIWSLKDKTGEDFVNIGDSYIEFSPCNSYLLIYDFQTTRIYDWKNKKLLYTLKGCYGNFIFTSCSKYLINSENSKLSVINWVTNETIISINQDIYQIALSPCQKYIASFEGIIKIWKLDILNNKIDLIKKSSIPLGKHLKGVLRGEITFSPNGQYLAVAFSRYATKAHIKIFDLINRTSFLIKDAHTDEKHTDITSIVFSPDEKYLYSSCRDKTIKIWKLKRDADNKIVASLVLTLDDHKHWVNSIDLSSSGRYLASASWDNSIIIYDLWKILP